MPTTEYMRAVIALAESLQHIEHADTLLRPIADYFTDQSSVDVDLDVPEVW